MKSTGSLFLTKSRHGIWYYQRWIPIHFRRNSPALNKKLKVSLQTSRKPKAIQLARLLSVNFDKLALQFFDNPKDFGKAMELLHQSAKAWKDYPQYKLYEEHFLSKLSGNSDDEYTVEEYLLGKAENFSDAVNTRFKKLEREKSALERILSNTNLANSGLSKDELVEVIEAIVNPPLSDEENPTLFSLFDKWCVDIVSDMQPASVDAYKPIVSLFIRFMTGLHDENLRINELDVPDIREFKTFLKNLPKGTETKNATISSLLKLSSPASAKMSKTTMKSIPELKQVEYELSRITTQFFQTVSHFHEDRQ